MRKKFALGALIPVVLLFISTAAMPVHASDAHEAGIEAFEEGDYERALNHFRRAEAEGVRTPNLRYNLGVTCYRLGRYDEAEEEFRLLAEYPDWRHLALYNLGIVAEARGHRDAAVKYYSRARDAAGESGVAQRATRRLEDLAPEEAEPAPSPVYAEFSTAAGYDDNAILAPEDGFQDLGEEEDVFTELYGLASVYLSGDRNDGFRLDADAFTRLYENESDYSFTSLSLGLSRHKEYAPWQTSIGLSAAVEFSKSDLFAIVPAAKLKGERSFGAYTLELSNTLNWIEGSGDYDYLTGVQDQLTARLERNLPDGKTYAGIGAEYNDREDLSEQGRFFSYSPLRGDVHAGLDYRVAQRWTLVLYGQYRKSLYTDENSMYIDGTITEDNREDDRVLLTVRVEYDVYPSITGFAEYSRTDNDSNFSRYSYESNRFLVGMRWII